MIGWVDGLEENGDGLVRQVPQRSGVWSSSLWITRDGDARRKMYNGVTRAWKWEPDPMPMVMDDRGRFGFHLDNNFVSVARAVALAWLMREPESTNYVYERAQVELEGAAQESQWIDHISWAVGEDAEDDGAPIDGETWRQLRWNCGIVPCNRKYKISSRGRLKSPLTGKITQGFYFDGGRWAAVAGGGLVDLYAAAKMETVLSLPPSIWQARNALTSGLSPAQLSKEVSIGLPTAWAYICRAAQTLSGEELRRLVEPLVSRTLWRALISLRGDPVFGESLTDLMPAVKRRGAFKEKSKRLEWEELRLARMALVAP